jgi:hypothetical protein
MIDMGCLLSRPKQKERERGGGGDSVVKIRSSVFGSHQHIYITTI